MFKTTEWQKEQGVRLKNDGVLELFFLGVGSAFTKKYFQNNLLLVKGDDHLLIDCGTLCPLSLHELGSSITNIENFLITHSHADHVGGLEEAALMGRYMKGQKPNMVIPKKYQKSLWKYSLKGGSAYGENRHGWMGFEDYFNVLRPKKLKGASRETHHYKLGDIDLKIFRTNHVPDRAPSWKQAHLSYGVLIDNRILFTADTKMDRALLDDFSKEYHLEYIFHDCQLFTGGVHASYQELKELPDDLRSKMFLCHYGDSLDNFDPLADGFVGFAKRAVYYRFD